METVSRELGIGVATLERWRSEALLQPAEHKTWTAAARLEAVIATATLDEAGKSAWCRQQGVYPTELEKWRQGAIAALATPEEAVRVKLVARSKHNAGEVRVACFSSNTAGLLLYAGLGFVPFAVEERTGPDGARVALIHLRHQEESNQPLE